MEATKTIKVGKLGFPITEVLVTDTMTVAQAIAAAGLDSSTSTIYGVTEQGNRSVVAPATPVNGYTILVLSEAVKAA